MIRGTPQDPRGTILSPTPQACRRSDPLLGGLEHDFYFPIGSIVINSDYSDYMILYGIDWRFNGGLMEYYGCLMGFIGMFVTWLVVTGIWILLSL